MQLINIMIIKWHLTMLVFITPEVYDITISHKQPICLKCTKYRNAQAALIVSWSLRKN